jgi:hypothetical protein
MSWFSGSKSGSAVDVAAVMDSEVPELLCAVVSAGAMASLGTTRDGGALAITVTLDGEWEREYFRDSESAIEWLREIRDAVVEAVASRPASTGTRKRARRSD